VLGQAENENDFSKPLTYLIRALIKTTKDNLNEFIDKQTNNSKIDELPELMHNHFKSKKCELNILYADDSSGFKGLKDKIYKQHILTHSEIARNEILAEKIIEDLWIISKKQLTSNKYSETKLFKLMPKHVQSHIKKAHESSDYSDQKCQIIADYISGMTDRFAINLWQKIFDPSTLKSQF
jgi:dGTP triphosphohydrolase